MRPIFLLAWAAVAGLAACGSLAGAEPKQSAAVAPRHPLEFINTSFENASPLDWEIDSAGAVQVRLIYDLERSSPNRAAGHWHFEVQACPGAKLRIVLNNFDNVWNGKKGSPVSDRTIAFVSQDGKTWKAMRTRLLEGNRLQLDLEMQGASLFVARLEPYRLSDLEALERSIGGHPAVQIRPIGHTVQGRELEIIRVGNPRAPRRVFLRARAHPWEPGGNWVLQGLVRRLLADDADARRWREHYCLYAMPLANKDGVANGRTRFNALGKDLNRDWGRPADPRLAPENAALEAWLEAMIRRGERPDLAIDLHNDESGKLHVSRPDGDAREYLARMQRFEQVLRKRSWFTEGSTGSTVRNPSSIGEGLLARYGIPACVLELNANWIAGAKDYPTAANWERFGAQLCTVFEEYFQTP
jgi:hypothetical protein